MKKIIISAIVISAITILTGCNNPAPEVFNQVSPKQNQVCFQDNCFEVELATTPKQWTQGLMYQKSLEQNKGMLFIFQDIGKHAFWMKNTLIPLDIIWLNANQKIVYIYKNAQPCQVSNCPTINPDTKSKYVLEINAGKVDEIGLRVGNKSDFIID